ncbi:tRNA uridine-5-carboxymethylaminomethyl(34) synthesis GTPase MnmE [Lyngbya confervoides]|uniref:tRNA modification GTPase MnmE n=1 Tax=Lyngbya confervoides BDU141951 TaxID=1574623 RepID=A0ABD4T984_9CYAN|nr:tRNA uridine-5-carboxymethylaminomethyl(34) synthesis GTPase MnmE [Lyngbya confervoides]MCM1985048.1 tRNA uridine-5-carboxymethylaminomethyl(34) synthesis GTPase MnmE [Lyngbya confervoides BDU141951]
MHNWEASPVGGGGTTIAAIATAVVPQQGSISIVRLSGPDSVPIARRLFQAPGHQPWESHRILYGKVCHPVTQAVIDEALLLLMLQPRSFTRENVVEFHCHGGMIAVQQVLQLCLDQGAVLAQPGEFSLRAFLNGRLDLTQAESIADLVGARSPQAAQAAMAGLQGKLAAPIAQMRRTCLDLLAEIEARIDFAEDLPPLDEGELADQIQQILQSLTQLLATADRGELLRTGLKVAIVGQPNVGKSSLLNAWSRSDRAIVTDLPGTTRDVVESNLVVGGIPVQVLDTAGIREAHDQVEQLGISRSLRVAQEADLVLLTIDASQGWTRSDQALLETIMDLPKLLVVNKVDLVDQIPPLPTQPFQAVVYTAAAQAQGIQDLETAILQGTAQGQVSAANLDFAINQRQAAALGQAQISLENLLQTLADQLPLDFWTIDLREAVQRLGEITGEDLVESVLDQIFSKFCIGK